MMNITVRAVMDENRDELGRFKPGRSGNPKGRPASRERFVRLLEAAEAAGARVVIELVPPRRAVCQPRRDEAA